LKKLLIRADDLGYSEAINYGLAKAVTDGLVKSAGIMTNMSAAKHGVSLLSQTDVCLGQHLNICAGRPLTDPAKIPSITGTDGQFKTSKEYRSATVDLVDTQEAILEVEAQYREFIHLTGFEPRYFGAHAIASKNFTKAIQFVADQHGLKYCGSAFDGSPFKVGGTMVYSNIGSMSPDYDPFIALQTAVTHAHDGACDMFVCHPGYLDATILKLSSLTIPRTLEVDMLCDCKTKEWLSKQDIALVTFDDL